MKIPAKYSQILFGLIMAAAMGITISFVQTIVNHGFVQGFTDFWMKGFAVGFLVAFPTATTIVPWVQKLVSKITT